ncbi:MAG: hypothetical protein ACREJ3_16920, partial [Polyangiaceae bacterium]
VPWSDRIAMDAALDAGDLRAADKLAAAWGRAAASEPLRALRLGRLARYEGRLDEADALTRVAVERGTVTPRVLWERVLVLVARDHASEVAALLARYPLVLGPLATWLSAYATASSGKAESILAAKGMTATLDPPPDTAPFEVRMVAATALGAMRDKKRGRDYVRALLETGSVEPDLATAALSLGFRAVARGTRRVRYE